MHTVIGRVTVVTVELVIAHADVGPHKPITELRVADTAFETVDVVE